VLQLNQDDRHRDRQSPRWVRRLGTALIVLGCMAKATAAAGQAQTPSSLTIGDAIELARKNYPSLKEVRARAEGAEAGVRVARTAYVPRLDVLWQANRAT
jgi:outer membrane protein TolC